ncbi:MAG: hypothetical protein H6708_30145 [Kofleriaceae bacterium]|nr:hypothetical protein [Kofleriaceae bacterium]
MADVLRCPTCASDELSPPARYSSFETHARFDGGGGRGLFGAKDLVVTATRARICLACGYLLLFVSERDLDGVRALDLDDRGHRRTR